MGVRRLPIVGVMGSGRDAHAELSIPLGRWLATQLVHLLTGGGAGVMQSVSQAFVETKDRRGLVIGVLPLGNSPESPPGYPNPFVEISIRTHLPLSGAKGADALSRNHVNVLSADAVVALPGSAGTSSEVQLALRYGKPLVAFVHSRDDIPGLSSEVPVAPTLDDVQDFVTSTLGL
ncbi:MAG: molybdenum cofactor carrier protein [Gammaproteobacteria bacterium]